MSFPQTIKVSGFPFMLQGWNSKYHKTSEMSDGCPVYQLNSYILYYFIDIIGVKLFRVDGIWVLQRMCDVVPAMDIKKYGLGPQPDPFGFWSMGAYVTPI